MIWIHITAGLVSLAAGFAALYSAKGGPLHRRAGLAFVVAMVTMTGTAEIMASFLNPNRGNQVVAAFTFYLVATSWLAVARPFERTRRILAGLMAGVVVVSTYAFMLGFEALGNANGAVDKIPAAPLFVFGSIGFFAAAMDARLLWVGRLEGRTRLVRHLWRMTWALWVATASAFLGQAKFIPEPYRDIRLLALPVLAVLLTLLYWLVRMLWRRPVPVKIAARMRAPVGAAEAANG